MKHSNTTANITPELTPAIDGQNLYPRRAQLLAAHPEVEELAILERAAKIVFANSSFRSKQRQLFQLTDEIGKLIEGYSICQSGCAHCCHMPTFIYAHEAEAIGHASGATPINLAYRNPEAVLAHAAAYVGVPCPFLGADKTCSVYNSRPLICRLHHSLGDSSEDCVIINGFPRGEVPKIDPDLIEMPYHELVRRYLPREPWGAIQDFFPMRWPLA